MYREDIRVRGSSDRQAAALYQTATSPTLRSPWLSDLAMGLYSASIIIGAGLLTLPSSAAHVGALPLLLALVVMDSWLAFMYRRVANSLHSFLERKAQESASPENVHEAMIREVMRRGSRQMSDALHDAHLGRAGQFALEAGMFLFVLPADIGYIILGSRSLTAIADWLTQTQMSPLIVGVSAVVLFMLAWRFEDVFARPFLMRSTLKKVCMMAAAWLTGIAILLVTQQSGLPLLTRNGFGGDFGLLLFTGAIIAAMFTKGHTRQRELLGHSSTLRDEHTVNVIVALFEIVLLVVTAGIVVGIASAHGLIRRLVWTTPETFSLGAIGHWANLIGVVLFSFVGTGIFNLCTYPRLFIRSGRRAPRLTRVVLIGTMIPLVIYALWSLVSLSTLPGDALIKLDQAKEYSTIGMARLFIEVDPAAASAITLFGYTVALLAVTSACNGFTESLADTLHSAIRRDVTTSHVKLAQVRFIILAGALICALAVNHWQALNLTGLLAVSGTAGGGLLLLVLPWFLPARGKRKSSWASVMIALMTALILIALILIGIDFQIAQNAGAVVVKFMTILIALSVLGVAIWLIVSEPE